ncbi:glycosyltransferase [Glutamicibacter mysorens]|uniref:glycosyltransferase n=1 Tax=Glutamicibacter mysorens TaxID=257984 RepID=UPI0020C5D35F|nr:glycosyltransferase [Glutamicibacter mysorens]UTM47555.1 glycosyltransferase [Glutamicibacter mysorens]
MKRSNRNTAQAISSRAELFSIRQEYLDLGGDFETRVLDDLAKYRAQASKLSIENEKLRARKVKSDGLIARLEGELASVKDARQKLSREASILKKQLANEHKRAEKFKSAYENLKNHPVVRAARGLKSPFARKPVPPRKAQNLSHTLAPKAISVSSNIAPSSPSDVTSSQDRFIDAIKREADAYIARYRDLGEIVEPAAGLSGLAKEEEAPASFGALHDQILGQSRLLDTLPAVPPKTSTPAYVPQPDKVMYCAHSTGEYNSNGYSTRTTGLTTAVTEAGIDLFIAARPGYPWDSKVNKKMPKEKRLIRNYQGVDTYFNPGVSLRNDPLDKFVQIAADIYVREAMMNRPSVIVSASNHITALPALIAARRLGIPFIYEVRGLWEITAAAGNETWHKSERFELARRIESLVANEADRAFAITEEVREELVKRGAERGKIEILPNAANIFQFVPLPAERSKVVAEKKKDEFLLGYAGSLVDYEGLDLLINAIAELPESLSHVGAIIVGDGSVLPALKQQVSDLGLDTRVRFTGRVPNEQINDYLAIFDAVVCPRKSNIVTELVSPLKPIEAMAAGRPVIGSNVSPIATLLGIDGTHGLLFDADNVQSLSEAIAQLAVDPKTAQDMGRRSRKWTVENRTWPIVAKTFIAQIGSVQDRRPTGKKLDEIRMALIADEFTTSTIRREVNVVSPTPENWREVLASNPVDVLLVESAWAGNDGTWTRKVGYYDDEECADLVALIGYCRSKNIPTIFWNKEDPVHFNRFRRTAKYFDVVLTTDANCLNDYWEHRGGNLKALGSLSFWAQAEIHNPMGTSREYSHTVAYGGSYYGDRYAERSKELRAILEGARPQGLTIYDRQADNPDSPYKFPPALQEYVQGGLTYKEMVEAYKSHPVHVNVNSVNASPTMFSRRVFELAACGTPVISGKSFGVTWMFDGSVPVVASRRESELISALWMNSEADRVADAWAPLRVTFRKHLAQHRLALALRMAGLAIDIPALPSLGIELETMTEEIARDLLAASVRPAQVFVAGIGDDDVAANILRSAGIEVLSGDSVREVDVIATNVEDVLKDLQVLEDMLIAMFYGQASTVQVSDKYVGTQGLPLWMREHANAQLPTMKRTAKTSAAGDVTICLRRPLDIEEPEDALTANHVSKDVQNVLVVGHDLKFAGSLMSGISGRGHNLMVDKWDGHAQHNVEESQEFLEDADTVFCEWSLGNLAWYSKHLKPGQKLVTRFHSQELFTDYPRSVNFKKVDKVIFVSELIRGMAIQKFGIPAAKTMVIPNSVDTKKLDLPKSDASKYVLGFVGMVPQMKRFDLVLDLLEKLRAIDSRYTLRVKGKRPEDYPWMAAREDEMAFYEAQYARIEESGLLRGAVTFDPQGDDMAQWYQGIGVAVSTSDFESFHFTLADGAASRALPVGLAWPGAEWLYPNEWLHADTESAAQYVVSQVRDQANLARQVEAAREFTVKNYSSNEILDRIMNEIEAK